MTGRTLDEATLIPSSDPYAAKYDSNKLHFPIVRQFQNENLPAYVLEIQEQVFSYLAQVQSAPGLQFKDVPETFLYKSRMEEEQEDEDGYSGSSEGFEEEKHLAKRSSPKPVSKKERVQLLD